MGAFVAILIGTIIGGAAAGASDFGTMLLAIACLAFALMGAWPRVSFRSRVRRSRIAHQLESVFGDMAQSQAGEAGSYRVSEPARDFMAVVRRRDVSHVVFQLCEGCALR